MLSLVVWYENITGGGIDGSAVWMDMQYGGGSQKPCPENETSIFSNITVRNLRVHKATVAYTFVGDTIKHDMKRPTIEGVTLENIHIEKYEHKGECSHASIELRGSIIPGLPMASGACEVKS